MREAVERGYEAASPDGVVLLAPACSSFDWFRDYAERGRGIQGRKSRTTSQQRRRGDERKRSSSEQSSVGPARVGAYRWERRLPRSARWVSHSTSRLATADAFGAGSFGGNRSLIRARRRWVASPCSQPGSAGPRARGFMTGANTGFRT